MRYVKITASADGVISFGTGNGTLMGVLLNAAAAAATLEIFDGTQGAGNSVGKVSAAIGTSANMLSFDSEGLLLTKGQLSATLTGAGAVGYVYYK